MKHVALIEKNSNKLIGWGIPKDWDIFKNNISVEVENNVWQKALNINANCYENGFFIVKDFRTYEEIELETKQNKLNEAKQYLQDTGWIWEKYNRNVLVLKDTTNEEFASKYADIISKQEEYRLLINDLES